MRAIEAAPGSPERLDDDTLRKQLGAVQARARNLMREFNIGSGHICAMARDAEMSITDTALRAEFLRLLIDLHEFGRTAKRRGLLQFAAVEDPVSTGAGQREGVSHSDDGRRMHAPQAAGSDAVTEDASRDFLARLEGTSRVRQPKFPTEG